MTTGERPGGEYLEPPDDWSERLVERLGQRLAEARRRMLVNQIATVEYDTNQFQDFFTSLAGESDRALAIVSFAYIEDQLKMLLCKQFSRNISGGPESLFDAFGPLSTAAASIKLAAALNWLSPTTYRNLDLLRKIRNEFAHTPFLGGFTERVVDGYLSSMEAVEAVISDGYGEPDDDLAEIRYALIAPDEWTRRNIFHLRSVLTCQNMLIELLTIPLALRMSLNPSASLHEVWVAQPLPIKDIIAAGVEVVKELLTKPQVRK